MVATNEKVYTENLICPYCLEDITKTIQEFIMLPMFVIKHPHKYIEVKDSPICPNCGKQFKAIALLTKSYYTEKPPEENGKDG